MTGGLPAADRDGNLKEVDELRSQIVQIKQVCVDHQEELLTHRQALHHLQDFRDNIFVRVAELDLSLAGVSDNTARHGKAISSLTEEHKCTSQALDAVVRAVKRLARSRARIGTSGMAQDGNGTGRARCEREQKEPRAHHPHRHPGKVQERKSPRLSGDFMEEGKTAEARRSIEWSDNCMEEERAHRQIHFQHEYQQRRRGTQHHQHHAPPEHHHSQNHHRDHHQRHGHHEHHRHDRNDCNRAVASSEQQFLDSHPEKSEQHMLEVEEVGHGSLLECADSYTTDAMDWGGNHPRGLGVAEGPHQFPDERHMYWGESSCGSESPAYWSGSAGPHTAQTPVGGVGSSTRPFSNPNPCRPGWSGHRYDVSDGRMDPSALPEPRSRGPRLSPGGRAPGNLLHGVDHAQAAPGAEMVTCVNGVLARINEALAKIDSGIQEVSGNSPQQANRPRPDPPDEVIDSEPRLAAFDAAQQTHSVDVGGCYGGITQPPSATVAGTHGMDGSGFTPRPTTSRVNGVVETRSSHHDGGRDTRRLEGYGLPTPRRHHHPGGSGGAGGTPRFLP